MIEITAHGDVLRVRLWTRRSSAVGYDVSAYLTRGVLIDTGFAHVAADLGAAVRELAPRGAIVTHWHEDHAGNAWWLAERMPVWIPRETERILRERPAVKLYRHFTWGRPRALRAVLRSPDVTPLHVIPAPGHSADHHVVFDPETRTLFSADLWLGVKVRLTGAHENPYEIIRSLDAAIGLAPVRMFDAHRGLVENPEGMLRAKRAWLADTVGEIEGRLDAGEPHRRIVRAVLGGEERSAFVSGGEYSRENLVRAVAAHRPSGAR